VEKVSNQIFKGDGLYFISEDEFFTQWIITGKSILWSV